jgi:hypothetical protein
MKIKRFATMTAVVASVTLLQAIKADDWDRQTSVTLNTAVAIPGHVLAPGRYIFKLAANNSDRNIVQILNEDQSHIIAAVLTASARRPDSTNDTVITMPWYGRRFPVSYPFSNWSATRIRPLAKPI